MSSKATYYYPDGSVTFDPTLIVTGTGTPSRIEQLERENAALRADKERLDFLGQTKCAYYYEGPCCWRINEDKNTDGDTLRAAIDAARKEAQR